MNREQKTAMVEEVAAQIQESEAVFAIDYRGISVPQAATLRERLTEAGARFRVVKNTLTLLAADKAGAEALKEGLEGPTAFTFVSPESGDVALIAGLAIQLKQIADEGMVPVGGAPAEEATTGDEEAAAPAAEEPAGEKAASEEGDPAEAEQAAQTEQAKEEAARS